ncbi:MAG: universal stress protein [Chloroflexi bacterium]|nr:universal stress protein [Chloroflexota bacterium]
MKVLVPYDGQELAEQAAVMALELLAQHRLDLTILRVVPSEEYVPRAREEVMAMSRRLETAPAGVDGQVVIGRPDERIVAYADEHGMDAIAMSTHGRPMLARMLVGSVTDRVIRTATAPVLVFHPPTMSIDRLSPPAGRRLRVLVPLDGSDIAEEAALMAARLLRPECVEMTLCSVLESLEFERESMAIVLDRVAERLGDLGVAVTTIVGEGDPTDEIGRLAVEGAYDVIAVSTHGRSALSRMLVGSVADRLIRTSEIPLLVIQPAAMDVPYDPVSGEDVDPERTPYTSEYHGRTFYFVGFGTKQAFDGDPEAYVGRRQAKITRFPSPYEGFARAPSYLGEPVPDRE